MVNLLQPSVVNAIGLSKYTNEFLNSSFVIHLIRIFLHRSSFGYTSFSLLPGTGCVGWERRKKNGENLSVPPMIIKEKADTPYNVTERFVTFPGVSFARARMTTPVSAGTCTVAVYS